MDVLNSVSSTIRQENAEYFGSQSRYRPDVDGIRAIAVSSVVFFHAGLLPFSSGFVGVDIFFVISGYLIGGIILRETRKGRFDFANFYARRARRILPALVVVVLAICLMGWFLLDAAELFFVGGTATSTLLAISNLSFWRLQDYFASDSRLSPLLMTWSLGVEEQFYAFFPFLIIGIMRLARDRLLTIIAGLTLVSFVFAVWCTRAYPAAAFYLLPPRAWELGVGAILAAWEIKRGAQLVPSLEFLQSKGAHDVLACAGFLLLVIAIVGFDQKTPFPGFTALLPVLGTAALISAEQSWANRNVLSCRPLVFVGLISYSWYLWHWPLMSYLRIIVPNQPPLWQLMMMAVVSFAVAVLSWGFVEQPFRRATLPARSTLLRYAVVLVFALIAPIAIKLGKGLPQRLPQEAKQIEATVGPGVNGPCSAAWSESKPNLSGDCVVVVENRPAVALIGDSHAWALGPGLRDLAAQQNLGFRMFTKASCPPLLDVSVRSKDQPALTDACAAFHVELVKQLVSDPAVKVVLLAGLWDNPLDRYVDYLAPESSRSGADLLRTGLERMVGALRHARKQIVLVGDIPYWRFDPMRVALAKSIPLRGSICSIAWPDCVELFRGAAGLDYIVPPNSHSVQIVREVAAPHVTRYLDLFGRFCNLSRCIFEHENELLFIDTNHLSALGARYALKGFRILSDE
jgi:peptidoglycan/LPS O-acetylase OafA/YrhL